MSMMVTSMNMSSVYISILLLMILVEIIKKLMCTVIGKDAYTLLRNLLSPFKPNEKSFDVLVNVVNVLRRHFKQRNTSFMREVKPTENVNSFIIELQKLSLHCAFGEFLDEVLRDKLVCRNFL